MTLRCIALSFLFFSTLYVLPAVSADPPVVVAKPPLTLPVTLPNENYSIPLFFDVLGDGVTLTPAILEWDLTQKKGLKISKVKFDSGAFYIGIYPEDKLDKNLKFTHDLSPKKEEWLLVARWPKELFSIGHLGSRIEAVNRSGQVLWSYQVREAELQKWNQQLEDWKKQLRLNKVSDPEIEKSELFKTNLGIRNFRKLQQPFWALNDSFRLCLISEEDVDLRTRMCTRLTEVEHFSNGDAAFSPVPLTHQLARVIVMDKKAKLRDKRQIKFNDKVQFFAELSTGESYEFTSKFEPIHLMDMAESISNEKKQTQIHLVGWGAKPAENAKSIDVKDKAFFEKIFGKGWSQTIGDFRKYWEAYIPRKEPFVYLPGQGGGLFLQKFKITKLPNEKNRPYLKVGMSDRAYVDGTPLFGKAPPQVKLSTTMNSVDFNKNDSTEFTWRFGAKDRENFNKSYLLVNDGKNTFRTYREIFIGYPLAVSARLTAVTGTTGALTFMGEIAANYWFDNLFYWANKYVSSLRWGVTAKYFNTLGPVQLGAYQDNLSMMTLDLKYRLDPGLWGHDETWGFELGYNQVSYNIFQAQLLGAGFFWARSMPKVFDEIMNQVPYLRYPKWVDMEFIYYPMNMTPGVTLVNIGSGYGTWQLNFHGKMLWTKQFFGEAGFGVKQLDFLQYINSISANQRIQMTSFYGTAGLGWSF